MVKFCPCYIQSACPLEIRAKFWPALALQHPISTVYMSNGLLLFQVLLILSSYSVTEDDVMSYVL